MNKAAVKRHVKIVCTLGPASSSPEVVEMLQNQGEERRKEIAKRIANY